MFYPGSAGTVTSFAPVYPAQNHYYNAPMSAVLPGQHYYPSAPPMMYPQTAAPVVMPRTYGYPSYYGGTPTMIMPSRSSRHHRRHSSRRGFLGYL